MPILTFWRWTPSGASARAVLPLRKAHFGVVQGSNTACGKVIHKINNGERGTGKPPKRPGGQAPPKRPGGQAPPKRPGGQAGERPGIGHTPLGALPVPQAHQIAREPRGSGAELSDSRSTLFAGHAVALCAAHAHSPWAE
jgi:hypothetical protein